MALDVEQLRFEMELMWSGDWIYMRSMSSIFLVSLLLEWLQVHQHLCLSSDVTRNVFPEPQLGDHGTSSPTDPWKTICCSLPMLLEGKQL